MHGHMTGAASTGRYHATENTKGVIWLDEWPEYSIRLGIPAQFNVFEFSSILDHEVWHLQSPTTCHDEMFDAWEHYFLWKYILLNEMVLTFDPTYTQPIYGEKEHDPGNHGAIS